MYLRAYFSRCFSPCLSPCFSPCFSPFLSSCFRRRPDRFLAVCVSALISGAIQTGLCEEIGVLCLVVIDAVP